MNKFNMVEYSEYTIVESAYEILNNISRELQKVGISNIDELLLRLSRVYIQSSISVEEKTKFITNETHIILNKSSKTYQEILFNPRYSEVLLFIEEYIRRVLEYYKGIIEYRKDDYDTQAKIIRNEIKIDTSFIKKNNLVLTPEDINKTISILNEAVRRYYEIYYKKKMITTFSDGEIIDFQIEEARLAHLLGVNIKNIVSKAKYVDLYGITSDEVDAILNRQDTIEGYEKSDKATISVLHKIIDMSDDTINFERDRLEKLFNHQYRSSEDYKQLEATLRKYSKIGIKSKSLINFKPLEKVSMVLNMPEGYSKIAGIEHPIHSLLISRNFLSGEYRWSNLVANRDYNRVYFMSSLLSNKEDLFRDMQAQQSFATTSKVILIDEDESGTGVVKLFTEEEQRNFLKEVIHDLRQENSKHNEKITSEDLARTYNAGLDHRKSK